MNELNAACCGAHGTGCANGLPTVCTQVCGAEVVRILDQCTSYLDSPGETNRISAGCEEHANHDSRALYAVLDAAEIRHSLVSAAKRCAASLGPH
eukprot:COSAG02_NODE_2143_length_9684_cov_11.974335_2_plen_95_part_00